MPKGRIANTLEDFWYYTIKYKGDQCWLWQGVIHKSGYGTFTLNRKMLQAHRVAYFLTYPGEIEMLAPRDKTKKQFVLHRCDVRACVNPAHLFLGTIKDNNNDKDNKGRGRPSPGELNGWSKLTNAQAADIRALLDERKLTQWTIAKMFGVTQTVITNIKLGKTYRCQPLNRISDS